MNQHYFEEWEKQGFLEDENGSAKFKLTPKKVPKPDKTLIENTKYIGGVKWKINKPTRSK